MSGENVEVVKQLYAAFNRRDLSLDALTDDYKFVTSPEVPDAGIYRGEAAQRWLKAWIESFEELVIEAIEIIDAGDKVVVAMIQRGRPRGSQTAVEGRWWQVWTFRGGNPSRTEMFSERAEALEAAGLRE
jgi:ketosteroid isomerase-like protein